jgi:hypothetical protein
MSKDDISIVAVREREKEGKKESCCCCFEKKKVLLRCTS